jgi:hypothetical protein
VSLIMSCELGVGYVQWLIAQYFPAPTKYRSFESTQEAVLDRYVNTGLFTDVTV